MRSPMRLLGHAVGARADPVMRSMPSSRRSTSVPRRPRCDGCSTTTRLAARIRRQARQLVEEHRDRETGAREAVRDLRAARSSRRSQRRPRAWRSVRPRASREPGRRTSAAEPPGCAVHSRTPTPRLGRCRMRTRRRVLMLAYYFPPYGGGGVQRALKQVKYLPAAGFDPIVVTSRPGGYPVRDPTLAEEVPPEAIVLRARSLPTRFVRWKLEGPLRRTGMSTRPASLVGWPERDGRLAAGRGGAPIPLGCAPLPAGRAVLDRLAHDRPRGRARRCTGSPRG